MRTRCLIIAFLALAGCATKWPEDTPVQCRVRAAAVELDCGFKPDGSLEDCRIVRETPAGCGFGLAALEATSTSRLHNPTGQTGRRTFTTRFQSP